MKKDKKEKKNAKKKDSLLSGIMLADGYSAPVPTDVLGSYTGNALDILDLPQQDADDL